MERRTESSQLLGVGWDEIPASDLNTLTLALSRNWERGLEGQRFIRSFTKLSTTLGSASVEISPS